MGYIVTIVPDHIDDVFLVLNCHGTWTSRPKDDVLQDIGPTGPFLRYFSSQAEAALTASKLDPALHPRGLVAVMLVSDKTLKTLSEIQKELATTWTLESYSAEFKALNLPYRDFDHTLKHVIKATGKLVSMTEEADHGHESAFKTQKVANYLADLVICALRMASKYPYGAIDIESAVMARIREKADVPKAE